MRTTVLVALLIAGAAVAVGIWAFKRFALVTTPSGNTFTRRDTRDVVAPTGESAGIDVLPERTHYQGAVIENGTLVQHAVRIGLFGAGVSAPEWGTYTVDGRRMGGWVCGNFFYPESRSRELAEEWQRRESVDCADLAAHGASSWGGRKLRARIGSGAVEVLRGDTWEAVA